MSKKESTEQTSDLLLQSSDNMYKAICHAIPHNSEIRNKERKKLIAASVTCLIFMIAEIIGGVLSNSLAIATDAAHLLTDFSAFLVSLAAIWISSKPRTQKMSFGFYRAEVLGALISILTIWLITGILVYIAIQRIISSDYELDALIMMYVAVGGIIANFVMGLVLIAYKANSLNIEPIVKESFNVRSAVIHVLGDLVQSLGVLVASIVIYFKPEFKIADPICTFIFSVIVLSTTIHILRDIVCVLMEGFPKNLNFTDVKSSLNSIPGVVRIHNLRIWSLTMDKPALSAHVVVNKGANCTEILRNASEIIHNDLNIFEVTLQVEEQGDPVCSVCS